MWNAGGHFCKMKHMRKAGEKFRRPSMNGGRALAQKQSPKCAEIKYDCSRGTTNKKSIDSNEKGQDANKAEFRNHKD